MHQIYVTFPLSAQRYLTLRFRHTIQTFLGLRTVYDMSTTYSVIYPDNEFVIYKIFQCPFEDGDKKSLKIFSTYNQFPIFLISLQVLLGMEMFSTTYSYSPSFKLLF